MTDNEREDVIRIKKKQVEEIQATINNINETKEVLDSLIDKIDEMNGGAISTELILRFTRHEKEEELKKVGS